MKVETNTNVYAWKKKKKNTDMIKSTLSGSATIKYVVVDKIATTGLYAMFNVCLDDPYTFVAKQRIDFLVSLVMHYYLLCWYSSVRGGNIFKVII